MRVRGSAAPRTDLCTRAMGVDFVLQQERAVRTRDRLLAAAAAEFDEHGFLATRLVDVAASADATRGSVYFHFASKSEIAAALVHAQVAHWSEYIPRRRVQGFFGTTLLMLFAHDLAIGFRDDVASRAAMRLLREASQIETPLPSPFQGWIDQVRDLLLEAERYGEVSSDLDVDSVAWLIVANVFGIQEVGDQLEQRQGICDRLDTLWLYLLPGLGVAHPDEYLRQVIRAS